MMADPSRVVSSGRPWNVFRDAGGTGLESPRRPQSAHRAATLAALLLAACSDSTEPPRATDISLRPASVSLSYLGETVAVAAVVTDQRRQPFEGTVSWASSDPAVFTVDAGGVVTAVANGTGTLRASIAGLSAEAPVTVRQAADTVAVLSGAGQRAVQGSTLPDTVVVRVLDAGGAPLAGAAVTFEPGGGGSASPPAAQTDADGRAATSWTLGPSAGSQSLAARVADGPSAEVSATALTPAEAADSIVLLWGESRRAAPGHTLPVVVRVVDEAGRPVPGATVDFVPGEGNGVASPGSAATGEDGLAAADWRLGEDGAVQTLAVSMEDGPSSAMSATVVAPAAVRATEADLEGAAGREMAVSAQLVGGDGAPLEGSLRFEPAEGHGMVDIGDGPAAGATARSDTSGTASVAWTPMGDVAGQPEQTIAVSVPGFPGVPALDVDLRVTSGICYRTPQVVDDLLFKLTPVTPDPVPPKQCADVTLDDLSSNPFVGWFELSGLGIASLKPWDFAGIDLVILLLADNELAELPAGVFSGAPHFPGLPNLRTLSLAGNRLDFSALAEVYRLSNLQALNLSANPMGDIPDGAFEKLPTLETLRLEAVELQTVRPGAFRGLSSLWGLSLAGNEAWRTIETDAFRGLSALLVLDLSRAGIETIEPGAFRGLAALRTLEASHTSRLTTLPTGAFQGLSGMRTLLLDSMAVSAIEPDAFDGLDSLESLTLQTTELAGWSAGAFRGMPKLELLRLSDNARLTTLPANAFSGLSAPALAITDGAVSAIEPGAFEGSAGLETLVLDGNGLASWPAGAWRGPSALTALSLARNGIGTLPADAFADQPELSVLRLADNAISDWPAAALAPLTELRSLDLSDNELPDMSPDAFQGLAASLRLLDLRGNPGAPFLLELELGRAGSGDLKEGEEARVRATTVQDGLAPLAVDLGWKATGDVVGLRKGAARLAAGAAATEPWVLSGDNNGAAGGAQVAVTATVGFESDSIFGFEVRLADTLVLDFAADSTRTNRRPMPADSIPSVFLEPSPDGDPDTAFVSLADYFTDPDGDSLAYEVVVARDVVAASVAGDSLTLLSRSPGRTSVEIRAFDPGGFAAVLEFDAVVRGQFDVEIAYVGDVSDAHKAIFERAAERWESIFVEGLPNVDFSEENYTCGDGFPVVADTVRDVRIFAAILPIDGDRQILARASPCAVRADGFLPVLGFMEFDEADIPLLENEPGGLEAVVLHEMAHVLGLGTIWHQDFANLIREPSIGNPGVDTHFVGERAIAAFDAAGGSGYTAAKVPVENNGEPGSADAHWRESVLQNELMTSIYNTGNAPISAITIQSMADLGYAVDLRQADAYSLPTPGGRALAARRCAEGRCFDLSGDVRSGPIAVVDPNGRVAGVIRR